MQNNDSLSNIQVMLQSSTFKIRREMNVCFRQLYIQTFKIAHCEHNRPIDNIHITVKQEWLWARHLQCHHTCSTDSHFDWFAPDVFETFLFCCSFLIQCKLRPSFKWTRTRQWLQGFPVSSINTTDRCDISVTDTVLKVALSIITPTPNPRCLED